MIRIAPLTLTALAMLSASPCAAGQPIEVIYTAMARTGEPVAFIVTVNGVTSPIGLQVAVSGLDDGPPVGGHGSTAMTVPADPAAPGQLTLRVEWIGYPEDRGWRAQVPILLKDFPADAEFAGGPLNAVIKDRFGADGGRFHHLMLRFEPTGALSVWTPGTALLAGQQGGPAEWEDYRQLAVLCADRADDLTTDSRFAGAADLVGQKSRNITPRHVADGSTPVICELN